MCITKVCYFDVTYQQGLFLLQIIGLSLCFFLDIPCHNFLIQLPALMCSYQSSLPSYFLHYENLYYSNRKFMTFLFTFFEIPNNILQICKYNPSYIVIYIYCYHFIKFTSCINFFQFLSGLFIVIFKIKLKVYLF